MANENPIDDLLKSVNDVIKSADDFWKAIIKNHYGIAELMTILAIDTVSTAVKYNARLWLQNEYYRSQREQN